MNMIYTLCKDGAKPDKSTTQATLDTLLNQMNHHQVHILLLGGRDFLSMRVRMAQAIVRHDLTPSHWSHAVIITPCRLGELVAHEVPLFPCWEESVPSLQGKLHLAARNGLCKANLDWYRQGDYPNYALIALHPSNSEADPKALLKSLERFRLGRPEYDAPAAMLRWIGYAWGVSGFENPLHNLCGLPSATLIEHVLDGLGVNITPQVQAASSTPEALWQGAQFWLKKGDATVRSHIGHRLDSM